MADTDRAEAGSSMTGRFRPLAVDERIEQALIFWRDTGMIAEGDAALLFARIESLRAALATAQADALREAAASIRDTYRHVDGVQVRHHAELIANGLELRALTL